MNLKTFSGKVFAIFNQLWAMFFCRTVTGQVAEVNHVPAVDYGGQGDLGYVTLRSGFVTPIQTVLFVPLYSFLSKASVFSA